MRVATKRYKQINNGWKEVCFSITEAATIATDTKTVAGNYSLSFIPNTTTATVHFGSNSTVALHTIQISYHHTDTLITQPRKGGYRYGFNGMEKDDEAKGAGNSYTTLFRQYDPRLGRWLSLDPLMAKFPWQSPYVAFDNNPVIFVDTDGQNGEDRIKRKAENFKVKHDGTIVKYKDKKGKIYYTVQYVDIIESKDGTQEVVMNIKVFKNTTMNKFIAFFTDDIPFALEKADKRVNGEGGETTGGHPLITKGDAVDPTKFRSKTAGRFIDADNLLNAVGGLKSGVNKKYFDIVKDFIDGLQKIYDEVKAIDSGNSNKGESILGKPAGTDSTDIDVYKSGAINKEGIYTYRQSKESIKKGESPNDKNSRLIKTP